MPRAGARRRRVARRAVGRDRPSREERDVGEKAPARRVASVTDCSPVTTVWLGLDQHLLQARTVLNKSGTTPRRTYESRYVYGAC
jgi:hypothetical protein